MVTTENIEMDTISNLDEKSKDTYHISVMLMERDNYHMSMMFIKIEKYKILQRLQLKNAIQKKIELKKQIAQRKTRLKLKNQRQRTNNLKNDTKYDYFHKRSNKYYQKKNKYKYHRW